MSFILFSICFFVYTAECDKIIYSDSFDFLSNLDVTSGGVSNSSFDWGVISTIVTNKNINTTGYNIKT